VHGIINTATQVERRRCNDAAVLRAVSIACVRRRVTFTDATSSARVHTSCITAAVQAPTRPLVT